MIYFLEGVEKNERGAYRSMRHELQSLRNYQFYKGGLNKEGFHKPTVPDVFPEGKNVLIWDTNAGFWRKAS